MKNLKSILAIAVLLTAIIFTSCKKKVDTPTPSPPPASIVGTWTYASCYSSSDINTQGSNYPATAGETINFASNNTYSSTNDFTEIGIWGGFDTADNGTYSRPDSLIMSSNISGKTIKAKIIALTSNQLVFRYKVYWGPYYEVHFSK